MTTRATSKGLTITGSARLSRQVQGKAARLLGQAVSKKIGRSIDLHYQNAVSQVERALNRHPPRFTGIAAGGPQRFYAIDGEGEGVTVTTESWAPLTKRYRNTNKPNSPPSKGFWVKTGDLYSAFIRMPLVNASTKMVSVSHARRPTVRLRSLLKKLPQPMDVLISQSFAKGVEGQREYLTKGMKGYRSVDRSGLHRGGYAEKNRPLISRLTSTMGGNLLKSLRSKH